MLIVRGDILIPISLLWKCNTVDVQWRFGDYSQKSKGFYFMIRNEHTLIFGPKTWLCLNYLASFLDQTQDQRLYSPTLKNSHKTLFYFLHSFVNVHYEF